MQSLIALTMIDPEINTGWIEIFIASYMQLQFTIFDNVSLGEFKREFKQMCDITIMALKPKQLQVTTYHPQANAIIERFTKLCTINDMLRSFDLENDHENLEEQEDNSIDF
jgi:hypothetical protein